MTATPEHDEPNSETAPEPAPEPAPDPRRYASLDEAFRLRGVTPENQRFLHRLLAGIDIASLHERVGYLKVERADGGPAVRVHPGYTNGFRSAEEIVDALGTASPWRSERGVDQWGVDHPDRGPGGGGPRVPRNEPRDFGTCPDCFMALPATGICNDCG